MPPDHNMPTTEAAVGARKIDAFRGALDGSVSSQWMSRPDDQRFLSLEALLDAVKGRSERSSTDVVRLRDMSIHLNAQRDPLSMTFGTPFGEGRPTHWSFGQLCSRIGAPAAFIRDLPETGPLALLERLKQRGDESLLTLRTIDQDGNEIPDFRAITGTEYGRVWDETVVRAVMNVTDDGTWKVPGVIDWATGNYNPNPGAVTKDSTTLYASDRDVFVFLARDNFPIEVGKLPDGSPDYIFPGVMVSNSEVGSASLRLVTMFLRGVCMNRNLWGVQDRNEWRFRHTSGLPGRFESEIIPRIRDFSNTSASTVAQKVIAAKKIRVADDGDEALEFLQKQDFGKQSAKAILDEFFEAEQHPARNLWDMVQAITQKARSIPHQDARVEMETTAGRLMAKVSA